MKKMLSEMTLEELWQLFPIFLTEHQEEWNRWYEEENELLNRMLCDRNTRISHIGSTAIKKIWAKPILDMLVEVDETNNMNDVKDILVLNGYICMSESKSRISFNKGYTEDGFAERVYHLHLRYNGDNDELYFRDYLNEHPLIAKKYEELKLSLWKEYEHNRDGYTQAKGEFVSAYTEKARALYGNRYVR